ncbi:MAG: peroxiredoxin-like family protein [Melioribacter sp.]|uniref:peroxiredoxin-like family protein n=1 Tax=Rosettibacter primus TaxID=3111523 RepID=UPI00247BCA20|nr:peroxiredoxin-like family protein [Melioribacter sp.]
MKTIFLLTILLILQQFYTGEIMAKEENKVAKSSEDICPIKIGAEIPSAIIKTIEGKEVDIKEVIKRQKSIVIFYRGGWCPYCNMHFSELQKVEDDLLKLGYKIIAVCMDSPENLRATLDKYNMKYELYSDSKANAVKEFGIAFKVDDDYLNKLKSYGMDLEASSGETHHILPVPSVFIIDDKGVIQFEYVNPDYKVRLKGNILLEIAREFNEW